VAVRPTTEKAFLAACTQWEIDIISLDLTQLLPFRLKIATVGQAIARGIYFEIQYSPLFSSPSTRKNWLSNTAALVRASQGKNLIISSGAESAIHMRSPADIANLSILFGLNPQLAKDSMSKHYSSALLHAETRKTYRGSIKRKLDMTTQSSDKKVKEC
jgi:ribonuclease P/MRP protein subunit RPP1